MTVRVPLCRVLCIILLGGCAIVPFFLGDSGIPTGYITAPCYLSQEETEKLYTILYAVDETFTRFGISYFLDYGTLLGAVRDGKLIPWDKVITVFGLTERTQRSTG